MTKTISEQVKQLAELLAAFNQAMHESLLDSWAETDTFKRTKQAVSQAPALIQRISAIESGGWLPIESAPKDGTSVLTWDAKGDIAIDKYENGWGMRALIKRFHRHDDDWEDFLDDPTHWQPLPLPPNATDKGVVDSKRGEFALIKTDEMREAVARAMVKASTGTKDPDKMVPAPRGSTGFMPLWKSYVHLAEAAIQAMRS